MRAETALRKMAMGLALCLAGAAGAQEKLDLSSVLAEEKDVAQAITEEEGPGDMRLFTVRTDDDITSIEVGDIYKSERSAYKVVAVKSKGAAGGAFVVQRIGGRVAPGRKWSRVSGLGPLTIVKRETMLDLYMAGGVIMHPIALCMVATIVIAVNSVWMYRRSRHCPAAFIEAARRALHERNLREFVELSGEEKGLLGHICRAMAVKFDASTVEDIKGRCEIEANRQISLLRAPLRALNFISAVAPLLGLFGTVVGMVMCFESIAFEAASASKAVMLASGIRVALFTTVGGLAVAIPALFVLFVFNQKVNGIVSDCEILADQFIHEMALMKRGGESGPAGNGGRAA